eukprot:scaffold38322_cov56-Phaeocystis_antarctica.AAC.3
MLEIQEAGLYPVPELGAPSVLFGQELPFGIPAWSKCRLGSAPARLLRLLRARLAALGSSALSGRGRPTGCPATTYGAGARASRIQSPTPISPPLTIQASSQWPS